MKSEKIKKELDDILKKLKNESFELNNLSPNYSILEKDIYKKISSSLSNKTKGLVSSLYTEMSEKTLEEEFFKKSTKNSNEFRLLGLWSYLNKKYQFDFSTKINFSEINEKKIPMVVPVAGVVASLVLGPPKVIVTSIGLILSGLSHFLLKSRIKKVNKEELNKSLNEFFKKLKEELYKWFALIEKDYDEKVEELKRKLQSEEAKV